MERQSNSNIHLPPGFRFHPSDEELIVHYLRNKATSRPVPASIIAEVDLYKHNPWDLPKKALFGEEEWYFFSPRDRKYPNGARPNRAAASGYWKATGTDKPILTSSGSHSIGVKKALVFYEGRPPKGIKTDWIMHEYRLLDKMIQPSRSRGSMRLDDWVLCRVRQKGNMPRNLWEDREGSSSEPCGYLSSIEEQHPTSTTSNLEVAVNYIRDNCPLLDIIIHSQNVPDTENVSNLSYQGGNNSNSCSSIYQDKDSFDKVNSADPFLSLDSPFNPLKRKPEGNQEYENLLPSYKKSTNNNNNTDSNFCRLYQSHGNIFSPNPLNPILEFQEFNQLAFIERDLY